MTEAFPSGFILVGALTDRPAAGERGKLWWDKDGKTLSRDTGVAWEDMLWGDPLVTIQDIDQLLRTLLNNPMSRLALDATGRLRVVIDVAGVATPVTQSGTFTVGISGTPSVSAAQSGAWNLGNFPVDQRWELMQRADIEYAGCQRNRMTFA